MPMSMIQTPLLFWSIVLIPNLSFLLVVYRFCQRRSMNLLPWMSTSVIAPFVAVPALFARAVPESRQQSTFWKFFLLILGLNLTFLFIAYVVDISGSLRLNPLLHYLHIGS
jgi:hypothetical protein